MKPPATDQELIELFPGHEIDHDNKHFYRAWFDRQLVMNRCGQCGRWHHPAQPLCPDCWSTDLESTSVSGRGTIHLLIRLHQGPPGPGVDYSAGPYPVVVVELEEQEGLRFTSTVVGFGPDALRIGAPVELEWIDRDGVPFPAFQPMGGGSDT